MKQIFAAKLIIVLFFFTTLLWSIFLPVFEAPDETSAYEYALYMSKTWQIPDLREFSNQGFHHWQPLYFFLLAPVAKATNAPTSTGSKYYYKDSWERIYRDNPTNIFFHQPSEFKFDWDGIAVSLHAMRLVSVLLATGSVWFVFLTAREIFGSVSKLPIVATALFGFNPQFVNYSGALNVVDMVTFVSSIAIWQAVKIIGQKRTSIKSYASLGGLLGVAIISKMTSLTLLPVALGMAIWKRAKERASVLSALAFLMLFFMIFGGWFLIRNKILYGEFSGVTTQITMVYGKVRNPFLEEVGWLNYLISYPKTQWKTFWSGFSWLTFYLPHIFPLIMAWIYFVGLLGYAMILLGKSIAATMKSQLILLGLFALLGWLGITRTIFQIEVFNGKDMFFVSGALAIVVVAGTIGFWKNFGKIGIGTKIVSGFFLTGLSIFWMNQMELVNLVKWNFDSNDIILIAQTLVSSVLIWIIIVELVRDKRVRTNLEKIISSHKLLPVFLIAVTMIDLMVLFLLVIPSLYHQSFLKLIQGG